MNLCLNKHRLLRKDVITLIKKRRENGNSIGLKQKPKVKKHTF